MSKDRKKDNVVSRFFNKPLGRIPNPLSDKISIAFFFASGLILGIFWLVFAYIIPPEIGKFDSPMWFIFGASLPLICMWFGLIHRSVAWTALIGGYLLLAWFGLDDRAAFTQSMKIAFIFYLFLGAAFGLLIVLLNKYCSSNIPKFCRKLRLRIEKGQPPPEAIDNCTNILNDLWDEVRSMPESTEREELLQNLLKLVDKVTSYEYNDTIDVLFNEPEIRYFKRINNER